MDQVNELVAQREAEKARLKEEVAAFAELMYERLCQKVDEGIVGEWDKPEVWSPHNRLVREALELENRILMHPDRYRRKCVDAANFAMFARYHRGGR